MTNVVRHVDPRLEATLELATSIASGDLAARLAVSEKGDALDAIATALNMLAEELAAERRLRQLAEELLRDELDAYEEAPALFCSLDGESLVVDKCNLGLAAALGRTKPEVLGRSLLTLVDPGSRLQTEQLLREIAVAGRPSTGELRLSKSGGGHVLVDSSISRVRGADGRERLRIVGRDATEEKHLEAQLLQAQKMEAVGRLAGGVAHDFNNMLMVIMGSTSFLRELLVAHRLDSGELQLIEDAAARGASLTRDLVAFSRHSVVQAVPTDVCGLLLETERMVRRLLGARTQLVTQLPEDALVVLIDPSRLSQVLVNLGINARDAMPNGGTLRMEALWLNVDSARSTELRDLPCGTYAQLTVADTGVGMPPEVAAQAFEPFFTTKPPGRGSGLGLSTCHGIIHQAGGRMQIESEVGVGTSVTLYLPLATPGALAEMSRRAANEAESRPTNASREQKVT